VSAAALSPTSPLSGIRDVTLAQASDENPSAIALLTRRLSAGNEAAFREFHALYFDRLYHFLLAVTHGQAHAAQDALQETLLRVVRHAREFESEDVFWGWLKAVARNTARDGARKQRRYLALLQDFGFRRDETSDATVSDGCRLRELLEECLKKLTLPDRELIEGKYLRGATVLELAAQTDLTVKAVESRLLRLRRQLGESLLQQLRAR
jgi:RNA polymerase sigma factor (sigma-70 family)